jgi:putative peptidoglycan lipid II flippase
VSRGTSGSVLVAAGILLSRLAGFARERALAHYLGNGVASGAFRAALRIPNLLQNLFGEGVLSASFIPVYVRLCAQGRHDEARRVAAAVASLLALATAVLVALGVAFAPALTAAIAPGFQGEARAQTVQLTRILFPGVGLLVLSAWCLGILNSHRRLFLSYAAPVVWNAAMIAALVAFGGGLVGARMTGDALAVRLAWGAVVGSVLQVGVQLPSALRLLGGFRPTLGRADSGVREVLVNFGPVVIARGAVQLSAYVDQILASFLGPSVVSMIGFAQTVYLLPVSLFGMSVSAAELPEMSRLAGTAEDLGAALRARLGPALDRITFMVVPSAVAFLALGREIVGLLYQSGSFGARDTEAVAVVLAGAAIGLPAVTRARLCSSTFYAMGDTRTPLRVAIVRVVAGAGLGALAVGPLRHWLGLSLTVAAAGLVAAGGLVGWLEYVALRVLLARRIGALPSRSGLDARIWIAALLAGAAGFGAARLLSGAHPVLRAAVALPTFGAVYLGVARVLGVTQVSDLLRRVARR